MKNEILKLVESVRNLSPLMERICKNGSCYRLFLLLKQVYPEAVAYYDKNYHVVTKIGDYYYDINGIYENTENIFENPMTDEEIKFQKDFVCDISFSATKL